MLYGIWLSRRKQKPVINGLSCFLKIQQAIEESMSIVLEVKVRGSTILRSQIVSKASGFMASD
jgi:hypothetical protein